MEVEFRVLSGGSAVQEIIMPGTKWAMLRVFNRDNNPLIATHYCLLGNQSRLRADQSNDLSNFSFKFLDGANFAVKDELHLHHITWKLDGADRLVETYEMYDSGIKTDSATITLHRIK